MNTYIAKMQTILKSLNFYDGAIDGEYGIGTHTAFLAYHSKYGPAIVKDIKTKEVTSDLPWITEARKHIGIKEIKGPTHSKTIMSWYNVGAAWFNTDEIPWCGKFVAQCLSQGDRSVPTHWYRAKAYLDYGTKLNKPAYGCIGVMLRKGGGHVTFIVGETADGKYLVGLGGNQSDAVNLMKFPKSRFVAYVWPSYSNGVSSSPYPDRYKLPIYSNDLKTSTKES